MKNDHQLEKNSWLLNKFSLSTPWEMNRIQYREYANWCEGVYDVIWWHIDRVLLIWCFLCTCISGQLADRKIKYHPLCSLYKERRVILALWMSFTHCPLLDFISLPYDNCCTISKKEYWEEHMRHQVSHSNRAAGAMYTIFKKINN